MSGGGCSTEILRCRNKKTMSGERAKRRKEYVIGTLALFHNGYNVTAPVSRPIVLARRQKATQKVRFFVAPSARYNNASPVSNTNSSGFPEIYMSGTIRPLSLSPFFIRMYMNTSHRPSRQCAYIHTSSRRSIAPSRESSRVKPLSNVARLYTHIPRLLIGERRSLHFVKNPARKFRARKRENGVASAGFRRLSYTPQRTRLLHNS